MKNTMAVIVGPMFQSSFRKVVMERNEILKEIKERMTDLYGGRLKGIILYGSEVRGNSNMDSDFDVLVLLEGPVEFGKEVRKIIDVLYELQLQVVRPLEVIPVDVSDYRAQKWPFYREALAEGIPL